MIYGDESESPDSDCSGPGNGGMWIWGKVRQGLLGHLLGHLGALAHYVDAAGSHLLTQE